MVRSKANSLFPTKHPQRNTLINSIHSTSSHSDPIVIDLPVLMITLVFGFLTLKKRVNDVAATKL